MIMALKRSWNNNVENYTDFHDYIIRIARVILVIARIAIIITTIDHKKDKQ